MTRDCTDLETKNNVNYRQTVSLFLPSAVGTQDST